MKVVSGGDWVLYIDTNTELPYYYNTFTKASVWVRPRVWQRRYRRSPLPLQLFTAAPLH